MDELTAEGKAEIAEAIRIVREDKWDAYVRGTLERHVPKSPEPVKPTENPPVVDGPPANPPTIDPPKPKRRSLWWGEEEQDND